MPSERHLQVSRTRFDGQICGYRSETKVMMLQRAYTLAEMHSSMSRPGTSSLMCFQIRRRLQTMNWAERRVVGTTESGRVVAVTWVYILPAHGCTSSGVGRGCLRDRFDRRPRPANPGSIHLTHRSRCRPLNKSTLKGLPVGLPVALGGRVQE